MVFIATGPVKEIFNDDIHVEYFIKLNNPFEGIQKYAEKIDADLIIMGSKGHSEFEEMIMTTQENIITKTKEGHCVWVTKKAELNELAKNDGLTLPDFKEWFYKYDLSTPMAIIHFTKFRYE